MPILLVVLKRRLLTNFKYTVISPDGESTKETLNVSEQSPDFQFEFNRIAEKLELLVQELQ